MPMRHNAMPLRLLLLLASVLVNEAASLAVRTHSPLRTRSFQAAPRARPVACQDDQEEAAQDAAEGRDDRRRGRPAAPKLSSLSGFPWLAELVISSFSVMFLPVILFVGLGFAALTASDGVIHVGIRDRVDDTGIVLGEERSMRRAEAGLESTGTRSALYPQ